MLLIEALPNPYFSTCAQVSLFVMRAMIGQIFHIRLLYSLLLVPNQTFTKFKSSPHSKIDFYQNVARTEVLYRHSNGVFRNFSLLIIQWCS